MSNFTQRITPVASGNLKIDAETSAGVPHDARGFAECQRQRQSSVERPRQAVRQGKRRDPIERPFKISISLF